jgi:hypothetical protein
VHRRSSSRAVHAFTDELEEWERIEDFRTRPVPTSDSWPALQLRQEPEPTQAAEAAPTAAGPPPEPSSDEPDSGGLRARPPSRLVSLLILVTGLVLVAVAVAVFYLGSRARPSEPGRVLSGTWQPEGQGWRGESVSAGRMVSGHWVGAGSEVAVVVAPGERRWSGGLEIYQDYLHWTYVAPSPSEGMVHLYFLPTGRIESVAVGRMAATGGSVRLRLLVGEGELTLVVDDNPPAVIPLEPWDVIEGQLVLKVGKAPDEWRPQVPGQCRFDDLSVLRPARTQARWMAKVVPESSSLQHTYSLWAGNVDDQIDVLLDGRRLIAVCYPEAYGPVTIDSYLAPGTHTLTMRLFNRKWAATYGVTLFEDGQPIWEASCGEMMVRGGACAELGERLGMVAEQDHTFEVR